MLHPPSLPLLASPHSEKMLRFDSIRCIFLYSLWYHEFLTVDSAEECRKHASRLMELTVWVRVPPISLLKSNISLCNHVKTDRIFHYFCPPLRFSVFPISCDISIMSLNESTVCELNSLERLSFLSARPADWCEFSFVKYSTSAFCQSLFLQSLHSL